jgi:hypothetical protein
MPFNPDALPRNADWLRVVAWDLPTTAEDFLAFLGETRDQQVAKWVQFQRLPAIEAMPPDLRREVEAILAS